MPLLIQNHSDKHDLFQNINLCNRVITNTMNMQETNIENIALKLSKPGNNYYF